MARDGLSQTLPWDAVSGLFCFGGDNDALVGDLELVWPQTRRLTMVGERRQHDWEAIKQEVIAGQLSLKEIGRRFGCSDTAIRKKIKEHGWERNLSDKVRASVRERLVREVCENHGQKATDEQIVEAAAERGAQLVRIQRDDIARLRDLELKLMEELGDENNPPTKVHVSSYQGSVTETVLGITVTERISALQSLAFAQHKRIQLERQAFNLDDDKESGSQSTIAEILEAIDGSCRQLPGDQPQ